MTQWIAFAQVEPFGGPVDDLRAGIGPSVVYNMNRAEKTDPVSARDFFPWYDQPQPEPVPDTPEQAAEKIRALLNAAGKPDGNV